MSAHCTWDVVTTVKANESEIMAFCRHYLSLGASRIFLFLDDPTFSFISSDPRISSHSRPQLPVPEAIEARQIRNATAAARVSQSEWILHCDIDEYIDSSKPVGQLLRSVEPNINSVLVLPIEPVYGHFPENLNDILSCRYYRVRPTKTEAEAFWSDCYAELYELSNKGFWAHLRGKSFFRTAIARRGRRIPLHGFRAAVAQRLGCVTLNDLALRHFDALSYEQWLTKHISRIDGSSVTTEAGRKRMEMAQLVYDSHAQDRSRGLFERMMILPEDKIAQGLAAGHIEERPVLLAAISETIE